MTRIDRQPGLVLHRRAYRETSLIVELFTPEFGRVGLVARGARSARSSMRGTTEPFRLLEASWTRRGELGTLTGLEPAGRGAGPGPGLAGRALWCGLYANELLLKLLPRDVPEPSLYAAYLQLLARLPDSAGQGGALRCFELKLLQALGVAPELGRVSETGEPVGPDCYYRVEPAVGPVPSRPGEQDACPGRVLLALSAAEPLAGSDARHARQLMRRLLEHQLEGKVLHARRLFGGS